MSDTHRPTARDSDDIESHPLGFDQSRATYESLVNSLPLSLLVKDRQGHRVFANRAYLKFRGATLEDLLGKRDEDLFPPEIAARFTDDDHRVMESGLTIRDVEQSLDAEGQQRWIERIKSPIFDQHGVVIGVQLLFWDVTDQVVADRELRRERDLLSTLLRHIPDAIYFKDRESRFLRISEAMARKFGFESSEAVIGKTDADIFSDEHAAAARADEIKVMESRQPLVDRIEKETWHDRQDTWCLSTKMPFINESGNVIGTFGISRDITELKKFQDELREARDAADRANRAKSDFLANMSHEIRTPMNAIIGMSELLAQSDLNEEQRDYAHLVRDSADALLRLLNDILDFSKIEARKLELESIPFSLRDLVEKTARTLSIRGAEKGLEIACRVAPDVPDRLLGDPGRLRQVLLNLMGNAVKFTDEGEVVVDVCMGQPSANLADNLLPLRFSVRDTGIGIPDDKQTKVIDAFTQVDASTTRRFGGTGLGLAISKQLVELMHGRLELESKVGFGTTFFFTAHFHEATPADSDPRNRLVELEDLPVLVVDDNPTNCRILKEILTTWRFDPALAADGKSALDKIADAHQQGQTFPLVILDCMMPEMDGFEVAERIRQHHSSEETKLIILSSATRPDDAKRCKEIGISRYMTKPVVQSELLDTVLQVMGMQPDLSAFAEDEFPQCPPLRVLVAEDGIANQHVAVGMLHAAGHQAVVAANGRETIARWESEPFDVILMDMHMPVMDGIEATERIRNAERTTGQHIPIIALTAAAMKEDAEICKKAGMDDYLAKPIHARMLQEMLARFAPEHPTLQSMTTEHQAGTSIVSPGTSGSGQRLADKLANSEAIAADETIDLRAAASRIPGGLRGVRGLAEVFLPECQTLMQTLSTEIPSGDAARIQQAAHTLKGSANLFFATKVHDAAYKIERNAKARDLAHSADDLKLLQHEVDSMLRALNNFLDITAET